MKILISFLFVIPFSLLQAKPCDHSLNLLDSGDLVFVSLDLGAMGRAMEASEAEEFGDEWPRFNHVGMVIRKADSVFVIESLPTVGVVITPFKEFLERVPQARASFSYLHDASPESRHQLATVAEGYIGTSYNDSFDPDQEGFYCSSFIYQVFEDAQIGVRFQLTPMTLGQRNSTSRHYWAAYFRGRPLPIGKLGISPTELWIQAQEHFVSSN